MKDKEVLQKAIEKAIQGGYKDLKYPAKFDIKTTGKGFYEIYIMGLMELPMERFIFSHDFAKAFWGEREYASIWFEFKRHTNVDKDKIDISGGIQDWIYHLQQMVLEENPIDYLRKFIN